MSFDPVQLRIEEKRTAKAFKLAAILHAHGVTSDRARRYDDRQRSRVAATAGTRVPSTDTWDQAVLILVNAEGNRADPNDPACPDYQGDLVWPVDRDLEPEPRPDELPEVGGDTA